MVDAAKEAEDLGFAWYTVGEHHFRDRDTIPHPAVVLAAIAETTTTIRLATGTTLVANRDPVLLAEDYALVDQLSGGRLEVIAGGSFFPEPWVVFDQAQETKGARKRENLELLIRLWTEESVTWRGQFRPPLHEVLVQPRLLQPRPPLWISGGTNPDSIALAVDHGLPMVFGTTAREPAAFVPYFDAYRTQWRERRPDEPGTLGGASHAFVAETSQRARELWSTYIASYLSARPGGAPDIEEHIGPNGPALCGSPAEVVDKLGHLQQLWGHELHLLSVDIGGVPAAEVRAATELIADQVLPQVRRSEVTTVA
ncbi:methylene-tetrahydromethanopterin reductase [Actinokineospora bangkokensis]|uniref:Methylene-tetrahydromethanopterin reductase n=1 Tax=Actinokineospora bangkokensis TaxID=1193682 RepID=A0A1Q9LMX7_9PSEU|nr:methylene-tetrahydromethanopterin reductase [Actinokineospora bangkokensis]